MLDFEEYNEYQIPPNPTLIENYKRSTKFSKVTDINSKKNIASNLPIMTEDFKLGSKTSEFSENGHGYTLFFKISKFSVYGLLFSIVPLAITLIILFHSGNDCEGETVNNSREKLFNKSEAHNARNQIQRYAYMHRMNIDLNPLDDIFEDRDGDGLEVSEVFGQTIEFFSGDYIRRFFKFICRDQDDTIRRNLKKDYREFCSKYFFEICDIRPENGECMKSAIEFYNQKMVHFSCAKTWINKISLSNRIEKVDRQASIDRVFPYLYQVIFYLMILGTLVFQWWHDKYRIKLIAESKEMDIISLMLDELPCGEEYKNVDLKTKIVELFQEKGYELTSINFAFDVEKFLELKKEYKELRTKYEKEIYEEKRNKENGKKKEYKEIEELLNENFVKVDELEKEISRLEKDFAQNKVELMVGKAFITFKNTDERNECFEKFKVDGYLNNIIDFFFDGYSKHKLILKDVNGKDIRIQVEDSYLPQDIIWETLKYSYLQKFFRGAISSIIGYIIVTAGFFGLYYMKTNQVNYHLNFPNFF